MVSSWFDLEVQSTKLILDTEPWGFLVDQAWSKGICILPRLLVFLVFFLKKKKNNRLWSGRHLQVVFVFFLVPKRELYVSWRLRSSEE